MHDRYGTLGTFSSVWQAWHFLTLAGVGQNEGGFGCHFSWQAQCLLNFDGVLKRNVHFHVGKKNVHVYAVFCENLTCVRATFS